jgi:non-ribosomal peptide synthetase component E (peptide arylation enzyme)
LRARQIATFKLPERLEVVDALPLTDVGKVSKSVLRKDIAAKLARVDASSEPSTG